MKLVISILFCIALPGISFGQNNDFIVDDSRVSGTNPGDNNGTSLTSGGSGNSSSTDTSLPDTSIGSAGGDNTTQMGGLDGTNDGQAKGGGVQMMGLAMAGMFASQCGPHNAFACVAAGLSLADAMAGGSAKSAAYQTGTYLDPTAGTNGGGTGTDPIVDQQIQDGINDLAEAGFTINGDGSVTGPDGQTFTADDLASGDSLMAKGATAAQAESFMQSMQGVKAAAAKKAGVDLEAVEGQAMASTAGAGGFGSSDSGADGSADQADSIIEEIEYRGKKKKKDRGIAEAAASDLATNFNGDPIGIGMGNLFLIVHKKYNSETKKNKFFKKEIISRKRERRR